MSKKIDVIMETHFPRPTESAWIEEKTIVGYEMCRMDIKQAITEKKLCVAMREEDIKKMLYLISWQKGEEFIDYLDRVAKAIYEAQFQKA